MLCPIHDMNNHLCPNSKETSGSLLAFRAIDTLKSQRPQHYAGHSSIRVFPKWNRNSINSANSGKVINQWNMNFAQFKDSDSHIFLAGTVAGLLHKRWLGGRFETFYCNDIFCHWIQRIQWKHLGKTQLGPVHHQDAIPLELLVMSRLKKKIIGSFMLKVWR